ncbi:conserved hypothetical protein [Frankia canadensis]|uniref:HTH cro/C1-type domain-containing protein n=1 Tax=Frankia canadensis TaxID=1836972 RepID=A0A2I2KII6_9ACTN|nr:hypothetical protein [Frankia canadensis]SNQ45485.1 conserved hypothetical protein [Frankia canadensis]SOU52775.1 conserved hypothetical protein [Frankia canadensis]
MSVDKHPGWTPNILRRFREAHGLTQDGLAERLRGLPAKDGFAPPAATAEMVRRHELGKVFPGVAYRRSYCRLFGVTEPELGFRPPLPGEAVGGQPAGTPTWPGPQPPPGGTAGTRPDPGWPATPPGRADGPPEVSRPPAGLARPATETAGLPAGVPAPGSRRPALLDGPAVRLEGAPGGAGELVAGGAAGISPGAPAWTRHSNDLLAAYLSATVTGVRPSPAGPSPAGPSPAVSAGARGSAGAAASPSSAAAAGIALNSAPARVGASPAAAAHARGSLPAAPSAGAVATTRPRVPGQPVAARTATAPVTPAAGPAGPAGPAGEADGWDAVRLAHEWLLMEPPQLAELAAGRHVGAALAERVEGRVGQFRRLDDYVGGRDLVSLVERELLGTVTMLREAVYGAEVGRRLLSSVAQLCQLAGWIAADAGRHAAAERYLTGGIRAAHAGADPSLAANLISTQAYQMVNRGDVRRGVLLAQTACAGVGSAASATTQALLADRLAWAHARAGDRRACERSLATVERLFARRDPDADPEWVYWLDGREIDVMAGRCWTELCRPDRAEQRLRQGLTGYDPLRAREISLYETWFAEVHLQRGDVEEACARATRAARLDVRVNSARTSERLRMLARRLAGYRSVRAVREFAEIYQTLRSTTPGGGRPRPEPPTGRRPGASVPGQSRSRPGPAC